MLRTSKLREYHSFITMLISDMNELVDTLTYVDGSNPFDEELYDTVTHTLENLNELIYNKILFRTYRNSPFKNNEE